MLEYNRLHPKVKGFLRERGIRTPELFALLLDPAFSRLIPPESLPDYGELRKAVGEARREGQRVLVWGHEDADGVTSVSVLLSVLRFLGIRADYVIPSKREEGHGLTVPRLRRAREAGFSLVITVDCGTSNREEVDAAHEMGLKVIVTDHHEIPQALPTCPVVNPKRDGGSFPFLAGVGVAFKVAWGLLRDLEGLSLSEIRDRFPQLIVWAAVGTMADRVPLIAENLALVREGTDLFPRISAPWKEAYQAVRGEPMTFEMLISLASAGKSRDGQNDGVDFLMAESPKAAARPLQRLLTEVESWFQNTEAILQKALSKLGPIRDYILLDMEETDPRYLGFISSRLKDRFQVPTIVLGRKQGGQVVAEVRTPEGVNSLELLEYLSHLFQDWGGHKQASGFSMEASALPELIEEVELYFKDRGDSLRQLPHDLEVEASELSEALLDQLAELGRHGLRSRLLIRGASKEQMTALFRREGYQDPRGLLSKASGSSYLLTFSSEGVFLEEVRQ